MLAGEQVEDVVSPSPEHIAAQPPSEPLDSPNSSESFRQSQQAIQEAQDLADLTDLREKALNSQPAAGQDSVFDSKYGNRSLIKH
ncbi:MAG: hypothetical protein H8E41_03795 [Desulfobulbaceae bacterium]|uniref:Uncharacterized protein n=1 Tax=Candidatus Desulfobia pelagia TaxID=2841692 RepID=A0A8J6TEU3_9BACT|nr:hypothetical protein [Candidatus Desulfobia pelagia]